jgi:putative membrane protein
MQAQRESRLLSLAVRLGINAVALWLAAEWVRGFEIEGWESLVATAAIFAVVNALIKPVAQLLGLPISCLTLGLFTVVINAAMLALTVWIAGQLDLEVEIDGLVAAVLAALLVSVASALLSAFVGRPLRRALR